MRNMHTFNGQNTIVIVSVYNITCFRSSIIKDFVPLSPNLTQFGAPSDIPDCRGHCLYMGGELSVESGRGYVWIMITKFRTSKIFPCYNLHFSSRTGLSVCLNDIKLIKSQTLKKIFYHEIGKGAYEIIVQF